jgi:hypothetical protein
MQYALHALSFVLLITRKLYKGQLYNAIGLITPTLYCTRAVYLIV